MSCTCINERERDNTKCRSIYAFSARTDTRPGLFAMVWRALPGLCLSICSKMSRCFFYLVLDTLHLIHISPLLPLPPSLSQPRSLRFHDFVFLLAYLFPLCVCLSAFAFLPTTTTTTYIRSYKPCTACPSQWARLEKMMVVVVSCWRGNQGEGLCGCLEKE
ncbi:uncharacterized protein LY89DRAFT_261483 [Mollisia scopiformis]|uniref:Uncharacterized protein n=1 Tax=Mollisia scopiformis TaxID=149040 RepID=A0A132BDV4_MOLSC|nr:uncharacterized protein LY89DRAFT_261483 [Mollisia scopiformis]KUJ10433.1 hypothetical protein LY89DRAFT_261483 [Mollisia scopiformis]